MAFALPRVFVQPRIEDATFLAFVSFGNLKTQEVNNAKTTFPVRDISQSASDMFQDQNSQLEHDGCSLGAG